MKKSTTHEQFRRSSTWKQFRQRMKSKYKKDYVTGSPLTKTFNLHHLNAWDYENLSEEMFARLNFQTHDVVHWIGGYEERPRDWRGRIKKLTKLCELMDYYKERHRL